MIAPRRPPSSRPFLAAPRTDFYHPARAIDAALHGTERAIRRSEGIGLIVGPPGTGKTLLLAKLAEHVRDDFDVALLSGARICTRRALWQAILSEIGEPYRGIDEGELRIGVIERVRGLAAAGSGLVILVDEAHTLPSRLLEELRLLTNIPTPLPAVHVVLAGSMAMEERLGTSRMESLAQRIGVRFYLESLDHDETAAYLRTQMKVAGLQWDAVFERGSDNAVFTVTDGVPRLINQLCDLSLVQAGEAGRKRVGPADIAAAWRDIQRLPATALGDFAAAGQADVESVDVGGEGEVGGEVIEFGSFDADPAEVATVDPAHLGFDAGLPLESVLGDLFDEGSDEADDHGHRATPSRASARGERPRQSPGQGNPWSGPEVELVFDGGDDPFAEYFADDDRQVERLVVKGPDDFAGRRHVASREGSSLVRQLTPGGACPAADNVEAVAPPAIGTSTAVVDPGPIDDSDMVIIEEDLWVPPADAARRVIPVRLGDYSRLFARMRRGGTIE